MKAVKISITGFVDNYQPGFVECRFHDALGKEHIMREKIPIITDKDLTANSKYPQDGLIACEIINVWNNSRGQRIITVDTSKPWGIESTEGITQFDLFVEQLTELSK